MLFPRTINSSWIAGFALTLAASGIAVAEPSDRFKVCADPNNPPFSNRKGEGFENKIAEEFAKALGQKLEYDWFPQRQGFIRNTLKAKLPDSDEFKCDIVMGVPAKYELTATTETYYRSTYALVYRKGRGLDGINQPADLETLPDAIKAKLHIAMFDGGAPGTTWLLNHHLTDYTVPYQSMTADASVNTAQRLEKDMLAGNIDATIVWGPIAGYLVSHNKPGTFVMLPMKSEADVRFEFPIAMGVRFPDKERKEKLNGLIAEKRDWIAALLQSYNVPLVDEAGNLLERKPRAKR